MGAAEVGREPGDAARTDPVATAASMPTLPGGLLTPVGLLAAGTAISRARPQRQPPPAPHTSDVPRLAARRGR